MKNQRISGIVLSYISLGINTIVNLIYVPVLLHFLGKSEYGLYQLMGSFIAYFSIMDFGLSNTVIRYFSKYKALNETDKMENVLAMAQKIYLVIDVVIVVLSIIIYPLIDRFYVNTLTSYELESAKKIYIVVIINILITISFNVYTAFITAQEEFVFIKTLSLLQTLIQPFLVILLLLQRPTAMSVVIVQTVLNLFANLIKVFYSYKKLKIKIKSHEKDLKLLKSMLKFSASIFIVAITDQLFWKTNQLILGAVAGTVAVAIYAVASQIYMNYVSLSSVIQGVFLPKITEQVTQGKDVNKSFVQIGRAQYILLSCVLGGFIVFGKQFISLWVGKDFIDAYYITLIIISAMTIDLIQSIGSTIMQAKNIYGIRAKVLLFMAIINVIFAIWLGKIYGGVGCAIGTSVCMILGNGVIMNYIYYSKVGLNIGCFWKNIVQLTVPAVLSCGLGFIINKIIVGQNFLNLGIKIIIYVFVYSLLLILLGIRREEKILLKQFLRKGFK